MSEPLLDFRQDDYRRLLERFIALGYDFCDLEGLALGGRRVFCRHDVDLSLAHAMAMAELERRLGVSATYYVLISTEIYNLASAEGREWLKQICSLGHKVGLHFDATKYAPEQAALETAAQHECHILETLSGEPVRTLSFHRPAKALLGLEGTFAGRAHTYEPRFFRDTAYVSDSNGGWHYGHPLEHEAVTQGRPLQLLTHPIWWMHDEPASVVVAMERLRRQAAARQRLAFAATVKSYGQWVAQIDAD
ncbi:hypothetical protein [Brevundimonas sp.]|uniref:hypothetical protein n=1 Tax=Brevundimonas sp. TaxID=1871086 RepID=UPI002617586C|nr:hypothetical protein [Brevundimonas sp.]